MSEDTVFHMSLFGPRAGEKRVDLCDGLRLHKPLKRDARIHLQEPHIGDLSLGKPAQGALYRLPFEFHTHKIDLGMFLCALDNEFAIAKPDFDLKLCLAAKYLRPVDGARDLLPRNERCQGKIACLHGRCLSLCICRLFRFDGQVYRILTRCGYGVSLMRYRRRVGDSDRATSHLSPCNVASRICDTGYPFEKHVCF